MKDHARSLLAGGAAAVTATALVGVFTGGPAVAAAACLPTGDNGLTAAVIAPNGAHLSGVDVDATGCDIGIYVGPGSSGTSVTRSTVTGANDHGIFVHDAKDVLVADNVVSGNGVHRNAAIAEDKALQLSGTSDSTVRGNTVVDNVGDGGIGVADDGPAGPAVPVPTGQASPDAVTPATGNVVEGNDVEGNDTGCGIVVAAYNPGGGIWDNHVVGNRVIGERLSPVVGGIVIATDPPMTSAGGNEVVHNTVTDSLIPGIIVHSNAPGSSVTGTTIAANVLDGDGWAHADGPPAQVGIIIGALAAPDGTSLATISRTTVSGNKIGASEDIGVCVSPNVESTTVGGLPQNHAGTPVLTDPACMQAG